MARHKRQQLEPDEEPALDISSLIDVCFLLLIYFLVTSTIKPRESDLGLQLPGPASETSEPPDIGPMLIHIEGQGAIYTGADKTPMDMDESSRDLPLLDEALKFYKDGVDAAGEKPLVQIYASDEAMHQRVIDVLNSLSGVGINSVTFTDLTDVD
ncbi:MAG: ExbD/TolR family protein [Luteolibacter sp.]